MYLKVVYQNSRSEVRATLFKHTNIEIKHAEMGLIGFNLFNSDYS